MKICSWQIKAVNAIGYGQGFATIVSDQNRL
jgi:hypothetical protein